METKEVIEDLFYKRYSLSELLERLQNLLQSNITTTGAISSELISMELLDEIKSIVDRGYPLIYFGKSLRDIKFVIRDDEYSREHEILVCYNGPKQLNISSVNLPHSSLEDRNYGSIEEIVDTFVEYINRLGCYFYELQYIDRCCTVMEPLNPTFKDNYRRILLDKRTWLHVEITPEGLATNIHLIGQTKKWQDTLQAGLLKWDHDTNVVDNIIAVFDLPELPCLSSSALLSTTSKDNPMKPESPDCSICLCIELPEQSGVPQPLCQNPSCGAYFHRCCLLEWLIACAGGRPLAFGLATGSCPSCFQSILCSKE